MNGWMTMARNLFGQPPENAQRELILLFDAIEQLISMAHLQYGRMQAVARFFSQNPDQSVADESARDEAWTAIIADTGGLIGTIQRLRLLVRRLPGSTETKVARKASEATVKHLEQARHHLEHLDDRIPEIAPTGHGAFGSVSWWYLEDNRTRRWMSLAPGTLAVGTDMGVTRVPAEMRSDIDHFWAIIGGLPLEVSEAYLAVVNLERRLGEWAEAQEAQNWPAIQSWRYR